MGQINYPSDLFDQIRNLQQQIDEVRKRVGLSSATISDGTLTVQGTGAMRFVDPGGFNRFYIGGTAPNLADGSPQAVFSLRDGAGKLRIAVYDPNPVANGNKPVVWIYDHLDHVAFTTDLNGGVAEPWIPVPMYAQFIDTAGAEAAAVYRQLPISGISGTALIWEGRIGKVSHPRIQVDGAWGVATVGSAASVTYTLQVGGVNVGSWTTAAGAAYAVQGPWDISSMLTNVNVPVRLVASVAGGAPADRIAVGLVACWMRQT